MLARLQRYITIGLLTAASAWVAVCLVQGSTILAVIGALSLLFGHAIVLAVEFVAMWVVNRTDSTVRATAAQAFAAWCGEVVTAPIVFCWRQPFRSEAVPDSTLGIEARGRRGVVFVHGFVCNRGLWNPWLRRLQRSGVPCLAVNLEPVFGSIDDYVTTIDVAVNRMAAATGRRPVIVAHSMGGLAVRAWMNRCAGDQRVHRVYTIGTPHRGTWLGRFGHTANARQMRLDAQWHLDLLGREPAARCSAFICYYSNCDNIVFPPSSSTLPGADNRHIGGVAHVHLAYRPEIVEDVLQCVTAS